MAALSPLTEARGRRQGLDSPDNCPSAGLQRSSDGHDATRTGCQNLSGCHDGMAGDNQTEVEGPVEEDQIRGILTAFVRNGRRISVKNPVYVIWSGL